jgi:hypothetical protein
MTDYRYYLLGLSGSIRAARDITCGDDRAAVAAAYELFHPDDFEVWRRDQRIYPPASARCGRDARHLRSAGHWRVKAEECRGIAEHMRTAMSQASFRGMAQTYDRLANEMEERAAVPPAPKTG